MNPRALAIRVLARVEATDAYLNVVLDSKLSEHRLSDPRDSALVTELCYGATRRRLTLDHAIALFANRRLKQLEDRVLAALRIGVYQIFYLRIPRHAAAAETLEALKSIGLARVVPFVNALLRKISALESPPLPPVSELVPYLSVRESHPPWLVSRWIRQFGVEAAQSMMEANNQPAPTVIRVNRSAATREEVLARFQAASLDASPTTFSPQGVRLAGAGNPQDLPGYREGLWQIQDEAAQLVVLFGDIPKGARTQDACAAPGGKSCHLAESLEVLATDVNAVKLSKLRAEAKRLGLGDRIRTLVHDAREPLPRKIGNFQAILVDAPCSGLGILRRHPELRYRRKEEDLDRLAALQAQILEACQERVELGGLLIYSVCSVDPKEGEEQIGAFLQSHPHFVNEPPRLAYQIPITRGALQTHLCSSALDGFFAARLRRTSST